MSEREFFEASSDWKSLSAAERAFCIHLYKHGAKSAFEKYGDVDLIDAVGFDFLIKDLGGNVFAGKRLNLVFDELPEEVEPVKFGDTRKNSHYFVDISGHDELDVYLLLKLYNVTDPCIQHAVKKLLCPGVRSGGKDAEQDIMDVIDTLKRGLEISVKQ